MRLTRTSTPPEEVTPMPRRRRRISPVGLSLLAIVGFVTSLSLAANHWMSNAVKVTAVVTGTHLLSPEEILRRARVPDTTVLADIDLMAVKKRIEANPVVREAILRRNPPSTLEIEIHERAPIAVVLNVGGRDWLIDEDGYLLPSVASVPMHALPVITGAQGIGGFAAGVRVKNTRLRQVLDVLRRARLDDPETLHLFSEASLDGKTDVILFTLEAGVPVLVDPTADVARAMRVFRAYWQNLALQHDVRGLEYVDLRFKDQVVVRWTPGQGPAPRPVANTIDTTNIQKD